MATVAAGLFAVACLWGSGAAQTSQAQTPQLESPCTGTVALAKQGRARILFRVSCASAGPASFDLLVSRYIKLGPDQPPPKEPLPNRIRFISPSPQIEGAASASCAKVTAATARCPVESQGGTVTINGVIVVKRGGRCRSHVELLDVGTGNVEERPPPLFKGRPPGCGR